VTSTAAADDAAQAPDLSGEDGRTRCAWVAGRPAHYAFHDAEWGQIPDDDAYARERLALCCLTRDAELPDALDRRDGLWEAFAGYEQAKVAAFDDAAIDAIAAKAGTDRARIAWVRDVLTAADETAKASKGLREYLLAVRWLSHAEQIEDMTARFPGFTREDAARWMEMCGTVENCSHERDCWRA